MSDCDWHPHQPFHGRPYMRRPKGDGWERRPITKRDDPEAWQQYAEFLDWMGDAPEVREVFSGLIGKLAIGIGVLAISAFWLWYVAKYGVF